MEQEERILKGKNKKLKVTQGPITVVAFCKFTGRYATGHENG